MSAAEGLKELQRSSPRKNTHTHTLRYSDKQAASETKTAGSSLRSFWAGVAVWRTFHPPLSARLVTASAAICACQSNWIKNGIKNHSNHSRHVDPAALRPQRHLHDAGELREETFSGGTGTTSRLRVCLEAC